ncbi:hypothetical protein NE237_010102 [Protea cynaroides]|uniref:3-beta hydroxysteroid dehydrogenase/isomerase domain-containing protein n=1 Tax=Protea cynaroides TaxID=273540 RepID=A0A9Q0KZ12_9MAGN|nr:hypothetical protein NE237_010102 [Protea cynaroides]
MCRHLEGFLIFAPLTVMSSMEISESREDERETKHLESPEGVDSRLLLFQIDLVDYDSLFAAINDTVGLFHLASPCTVDRVLDPEIARRISTTLPALVLFPLMPFHNALMSNDGSGDMEDRARSMEGGVKPMEWIEDDES